MVLSQQLQQTTELLQLNQTVKEESFATLLLRMASSFQNCRNCRRTFFLFQNLDNSVKISRKAFYFPLVCFGSNQEIFLNATPLIYKSFIFLKGRFSLNLKDMFCVRPVCLWVVVTVGWYKVLVGRLVRLILSQTPGACLVFGGLVLLGSVTLLEVLLLGFQVSDLKFGVANCPFG